MAGPSGEEKLGAMVTSTGYHYSDASSSGEPTPMVSQLQRFESNPDIYNLTAGMEMNIGFPSKNPNYQQINGNNSVLSNHHHHHHHHQDRFVAEDPSLRCVFPHDGNERPSQGLSLSLTSSNPSSIRLQPFELGPSDDPRFGPSSSRSVGIQQHPQMMMQAQFHVRNSRYLEPAQALLNEFCNLFTKQTDDETSKLKARKSSSEPQQDEIAIKMQSLHSPNILELQKRKTKLLQMLQQVDGRYKRYQDQMKAVVSSFEAVAGNGAAAVYSAMASRAMSRHFRCLRDGIVSQINTTKKAMGEKDAAVPGTTKGETPRLRILDQKLREQKAAFQQMSTM